MSKDSVVSIAFFLLRVIAGLFFMQHGGQKIFDWFGGIPAEHGGHPAAWSQPWIGGAIEFYGGLFILLGFLTRAAAFLCSGTMAVAYFQFHHDSAKFWPVQNGGEPAAMFAFVFLLIAAAGGGPWSLDALIFKKKGSPAETA